MLVLRGFVPGYEIQPTSSLEGIAALYADVGFRPDLVDDLAFVRRLGGIVFVARRGGEVVGAASCLAFVDSGWIGGLAVRAADRRHGLGVQLTTAAMRELGDRTILLHATDVARPLYRRLGFVPEMEFVEFHCDALPATPNADLRPGTMHDLEAVLALDRSATGEDRGALLAEIWPHGACVAFDAGAVVGFRVPQSQSSVGAVVASDGTAGGALLATALADSVGSLRIAVPAGHADLLAYLRRAGCPQTGGTTRMCLGEPRVWRPERIFATFNLYWG
ncbi:MAG TPA: GNAT family N-acetyltransferase [Solirubrobacteraceae bacterium]|nr:GNAT family N-acetyltransferase [Solirubrobacteraceae bacterium]